MTRAARLGGRSRRAERGELVVPERRHHVSARRIRLVAEFLATGNVAAHFDAIPPLNGPATEVEPGTAQRPDLSAHRVRGSLTTAASGPR